MSDADWVVADSIYGKLVVNRHDFRGGQILRTGIPPGNDSITFLCEVLQRRAERTGRKPVVIDVGANNGSYALAMKRYAESVTAIEPQPELFAALRRTVDEVNEEPGCIFPLPYAVGRGGRLLHIPAIDRSQYHVSDLVKLEPATPDMRDRLIRETTIDAIVDYMNFTHVDLIKIDTEGMEIDVVEGARETIAQHRPILFVEFLHCDRFKLQALLFELGYPSVQFPIDNDFLCDPDVPYDARYSYWPDDLKSLHSPQELWSLEALALTAPLLGGFAEIGVYKGGSLQRLADIAAAQDRVMWAFDTFVGIPRVHALDQGIVGDWHGGGDEGLNALTNALPKVHFIMGDFPSVQQDMRSAAYLGWRGPMLAFAHIDCGTYQSTKESLEALWPKLVSGGIMLMGDYGYAGSKLAADTTAFVLQPKPKLSMTAEKQLVLTKP